jgi:hypothetical protein
MVLGFFKFILILTLTKYLLESAQLDFIEFKQKKAFVHVKSKSSSINQMHANSFRRISFSLHVKDKAANWQSKACIVLIIVSQYLEPENV